MAIDICICLVIAMVVAVVYLIAYIRYLKKEIEKLRNEPVDVDGEIVVNNMSVDEEYLSVELGISVGELTDRKYVILSVKKD